MRALNIDTGALNLDFKQGLADIPNNFMPWFHAVHSMPCVIILFLATGQCYVSDTDGLKNIIAIDGGYTYGGKKLIALNLDTFDTTTIQK